MIRELNEEQKKLTDLIKASFWNYPAGKADEKVFEECRRHGILMLPYCCLSSVSMPDHVREAWNAEILHQILYYSRYMHLQSGLPLTVPYVILKGTSAARYYPHPEFRAMGDIDIITKHEDVETACNTLLMNDYEEVDKEKNISYGKHRKFRKGNVIIEIHYWFAAKKDGERKAKIFDSLMMKNIDKASDHVFPDLVNGLILLEHMNHHLEEGLGLRQTIDWMMFVHRCLSDQAWPAFRRMTDRVGLTDLAVTATRMCEIYLGLASHAWCAEADVRVCRDLMEYILNCGNFGRQKQYKNEQEICRALWLWHPVKLLGVLRKKGEEEWPLARRYHFLRPLAGIWMGGTLAFENVSLIQGWHKAYRLKRMFDTLNVKREHYQ